MGRDMLTTDQDRRAYDRAVWSYDREITPFLYEDADPGTVWDLRNSEWTTTLLALGVTVGRSVGPVIGTAAAAGMTAETILEITVRSAMNQARQLDEEGVLETSEQVHNYTQFTLTVGINAALEEGMADDE